VIWNQKGKTNLNFTEAGDSEWQWHQLGHMQVCTSLQTDNHASTPPLSFLKAGFPSCHPTNSVRSLKSKALKQETFFKNLLLLFLSKFERGKNRTAYNATQKYTGANTALSSSHVFDVFR